MAIFGDFADVPLQEAFRVLGSSSGCLRLFPQHGSETRLYLEAGVLRRCAVAGRICRDERELREGLGELTRLGKGRFAFERGPLPQVLQLEVPLEVVRSWLEQEAQHAEGEAQALARLQGALPHPHTALVFVRGRSSAAEAALNRFYARLGSSFPQVLVALERGISPHTLACWTSWPLDRTQLALYHLLEAGALEALRQIETPQAVRQKPGLLSKLLGALRLAGSRA